MSLIYDLQYEIFGDNIRAADKSRSPDNFGSNYLKFIRAHGTWSEKRSDQNMAAEISPQMGGGGGGKGRGCQNHGHAGGSETMTRC